MDKNWKEKGTQQFKKSNFHKALQYYRKYLEQEHSDNIQALFNISICYFRLEDFETAISVCDQALALDQKYAKCYYRRALCRKEILRKDPNNVVQKYKFICDCKMFEKYCNKDEVTKELEELKNQSNERKQQLLPCQALHLSRFQRDLMQLERENINLYAISWLDLKNKERKTQLEDKRQKINGLYKQLIAINRKKEHSEEQKKTLSELIKSKIKQLKSHVINENSFKKIKKNQIEKNLEGPATDTESIDQNNSVLKNNQNKQKQYAQKDEQKPVKSQVNSNNNIANENKQVSQTKVLKKTVDDEVKKIEIEKIKAQQNSVKQKKIQELTPQLIYKVYFVDNLQKSRDVILQFGKNLLFVLNHQGLTKQKKEQLLIKIQKVKKSQMKSLMKGAPKQLKEQIKESLTKSDIKQEIKKLYLFT